MAFNQQFWWEVNFSKFDSNWHLKSSGAATVWEDLNFDPERSGWPTATRPAEVTVNNCIYVEFASSNNQLCGAGEELSHQYKLSSKLYPHLHLFLKNGESVGTTWVTFTLYRELRQSTGSTNWSVPLSATSAQLWTTAWANKLSLYDMTWFNGSAELWAQLAVTIARTWWNAWDIIVTTYWVHYEIDALWSDEINTK